MENDRDTQGKLTEYVLEELSACLLKYKEPVELWFGSALLRGVDNLPAEALKWVNYSLCGRSVNGDTEKSIPTQIKWRIEVQEMSRIGKVNEVLLSTEQIKKSLSSGGCGVVASLASVAFGLDGEKIKTAKKTGLIEEFSQWGLENGEIQEGLVLDPLRVAKGSQTETLAVLRVSNGVVVLGLMKDFKEYPISLEKFLEVWDPTLRPLYNVFKHASQLNIGSDGVKECTKVLERLSPSAIVEAHARAEARVLEELVKERSAEPDLCADKKLRV